MIHGFDGIADLRPLNESLYTMDELFFWLRDRKENQFVSINKIGLDECNPWYYDSDCGQIRNPNGSFFRIGGINEVFQDGTRVQQPIIIQKEIGFLGIICKEINGTWHFLMQAKIEPGNLNYVQLSPTIQATKSNFTKQHGGREPAYLDFFMKMERENVLVDQIQSEQSSRFYGKRNRNVIIKVDKDVQEIPSHRWMTLAQIREFLKYDNLINMDTRTVLSCIPYVFIIENLKGYSKEYVSSIRKANRDTLIDIYQAANNYKMFNSPTISFVPLSELKEWEFSNNGLKHNRYFPFEVIFCSLEIEGREVTRWNQPLLAALGIATFGLICTKEEGFLEVLVQLKPEIGCFDAIELGPTVQEEYLSFERRDSVSDYFFNNLDKNEKLVDIILSEEGGRFYHEQNRNVIMMAQKDEIVFDKRKYVWASIGTLDYLTQINNCLNIQFRNLLMLLSLFSTK